MRRDLTLILAVLMCSAVGHGCRRPSNLPELGQVTGQVTLDGKPVPQAEVQFYPDQAKRSQGRTDASGHFELRYDGDAKGAVVGNHTIVVLKPVGMEMKESIPEQFNRFSELRREVKPGRNVIDLNLKSDTTTSDTGDSHDTTTPSPAAD